MWTKCSRGWLRSSALLQSCSRGSSWGRSVRWHLERVAINPLHQHDHDGSADRAALALAGCTDDTLETLLSCSADWHDGVAGSSHGRCTLAPALHHARGGVAGTFEYAQ